MNKTMRHASVVSAVSAMAILVGDLIAVTPALAQISEIVVTTRKREENLQDLPIAVTAIGIEQLQRSGTSSIEDITKFSPSFTFDQNSAQKDIRIAIRGLSPTRGRSGVAFLVDGIDVTSEAIGTPGATIMVSQRLLNDIQRVESVKGPQSALFGKAAFAGAISYVTRDAPDEFEATIGGEIAEHDEYSAYGSVGGPIVEDKLGILASGFYWDEEGQYENSLSGEPLGGGEGFGGALTVNFDPAENIGIKARFEYTDEEWNDLPRARNPFSTTATYSGELPDEGALAGLGSLSTPSNDSYGSVNDTIRPLTRSENPLTGQDYEGVTQEMFRASLVATWDLDFGTITSYTGYVESDVHEEYDWDVSAVGRPDTNLGTQIIDNDTDTEIFSQELRFQSDFDGPVQFTLGANYWEQERIFIEKGLLGNVAATGLDVGPGSADWASWQDMFLFNINQGFNVVEPNTIKDKHRSVYGMIEWEITEQFKFTAEGRYSEDDFRQQLTIFELPFGNGLFTDGGCTLSDSDIVGDTCIARDAVAGGLLDYGDFVRDDPFVATVYSNAFTPKITLEWTPNDDILVYGSWSKAAKPAGQDVTGGGAPYIDEANWLEGKTYDAEKLTAYELGAKTSWSGGFGDLTLNGAAFFQDFEDKLVNVRLVAPNGAVNSRIANAGGAEVWGLEFDAVWQPPVDGLTLTAGYTWLDTEYTEFTDDAASVDTVARVGNCMPVDTGTFDSDGTLISPNLNGVTDLCRIDFSGNQLERAPEHAFIASANYTRPLANTELEWFIEGDTQYQGERFESPDNVTKFDDYWLLNLRAGLSGENWEAVLFVDNVLDDDTIKSGSQVPDFVTTLGSLQRAPNFVDTVVLPPKRQVGLRANYRF